MRVTKTIYDNNIRLPPKGSTLLSYYMRSALSLELDQNPKGKCRVKTLQLLRLNLGLLQEAFPIYPADPFVPEVPLTPFIGCMLMKEFFLKDNRVNKGMGNEITLCRVYRRIRWTDRKHNRKYKDWKIKVL